jgi:hypothetical protein
VKEAIDETRELIKLEVALARDEVESELRRARTMAIAFAVAASAANVGFAMILFAVAFASNAQVAFGLIAALALLATAGAASLVGYRRASVGLLHRTRERLGQDIRRLEEGAHGA